MNTDIRIGMLLNETEDAALLLKAARRLYPEAHIVAIISNHASLPDNIQADEIMRSELSPLHLLIKGGFAQFVKELQGKQFDLFIIRFASLKLRLMAALTNATRCEIWLQGGTIWPTAVKVRVALQEYFRGRLVGTTSLVRIYLSILFSWVSRHHSR